MVVLEVLLLWLVVGFIVGIIFGRFCSFADEKSYELFVTRTKKERGRKGGIW